MGDLLQYKVAIQTITTALAAALVFYRPWTAVGSYLYAYALPYIITRGRAPLLYPEFSLGIPLLIVGISCLRRTPQIGRWLVFCSVALGCLMVGSALWGEGMLPPRICLGLLFLFSAAKLYQTPRELGYSALLLAGFAVVASMYFLSVGTEISRTEVFDWDTYDVTGDRNYNSFQIGVGAVVLWCIVSSRALASLLPQAHGWQMVLLRLASGCAFAVCGWAMLQFQSRGLTLALAIAVVASLLHRRLQPKYLLLGLSLAAGAFVVVTMTPAYQALLNRWQEYDASTAGGRVDIFQTVWNDYWAEGFVRKVFGQGANAVFSKYLWSTHNSFLTILSEQGLVGLTLLLGLLTITALGGWRRRGEIGNLRLTLLTFCVVGSLSIEPHVNPIFWLTLGLALPLKLKTVAAKAEAQPPEAVPDSACRQPRPKRVSRPASRRKGAWGVRRRSMPGTASSAVDSGQ